MELDDALGRAQSAALKGRALRGNWLPPRSRRRGRIINELTAIVLDREAPKQTRVQAANSVLRADEDDRAAGISDQLPSDPAQLSSILGVQAASLLFCPVPTGTPPELGGLAGSPTYCRLIARIAQGASVPAAVIAAGINRRSFEAWRAVGLDDAAYGADTACSRLVSDINAAALYAGMDAEQRMHAKDPKAWLAAGPGRWLHPEGTWQPPEQKIGVYREPAPPSVGVAEPLEEAPPEAQDAIGTDRYAAALAILQRHNIMGSVQAAIEQQRTDDEQPATSVHPSSGASD
jgi:hypothetical protein